MFVRSELKQQAKTFMEKHFPQMFLVCLIAGLFTGDIININFSFDTRSIQVIVAGNIDFTFTVLSSFLLIVGLGASIAITAFIGAPLQQGRTYYFRNITLGNARVEDLLHSFSTNYLHNVKVLFHRDIRVLLWTLLLIVPGVIKAYEYAFVDYILNAHPEIEPEEALELSSRMTDGLKWDMFVLDLSFILWDLLSDVLSVFTLGLSHVALNVYKYQTHAQLYQWVLDNKEV